MGDLKVGKLKVSSGSIEFGKLGSFNLADGREVSIPLMVANGNFDGPCLWISAAMHGQELSGIGVIWELMKKVIDPKSLRGRVIATPMLNPFSFTGGTYFTPQDGRNLSNSFPGDPKGGLTERLANLVYEQGLKKADVVIDLHCNPVDAIMFSIAFDPSDGSVGADGYRLAGVFGITTVDRPPKTIQQNISMLDLAYQLGKPSFLVEFTPYYRIDETAVRVGVRGLMNVMKSLDMIDGKISPQKGIRILPGRLGIVHSLADSGGIVMPGVGLGDQVKKGQKVGEIVNLFGEPIAPILSPVNGWLLTWPYLNQSVYEGDLLAMFVFPKA